MAFWMNGKGVPAKHANGREYDLGLFCRRKRREWRGLVFLSSVLSVSFCKNSSRVQLFA